jgi:hypothetical protein
MKLKIFEIKEDGLLVFVIGYGGYTPSKLLKTLVSTKKGIEPIWVIKPSLSWSTHSKKKAAEVLNILTHNLNCPEYENKEV